MGFFIKGVTTADLKPSGTYPSSSERFISLVKGGNKMSAQSLIKKVGHGSNKHDLAGELSRILRTVSTDTSLNAVN